jgi:glycerol kinase
VIRSSSANLSAVGAAWLAGLGVGYWNSLGELELLPRPISRFEPGMSEGLRVDLIGRWRDALERSKSAGRAVRGQIG